MCLHVQLKEGGYLLIGETVTVHFDYKTGRDEIVIAIDAPDDIPVLRSKLYEQSIAEQAAAGDPDALEKHVFLKRERDINRKRAYASRARRDAQERRMAAGEIKRYNA